MRVCACLERSAPRRSGGSRFALLHGLFVACWLSASAVSQDDCEGEWREWPVTNGSGLATQTALGVDVANNAYAASILNDRVQLKIISPNRQIDVSISDPGAVQGEPDFATNSRGVTYMTFSQAASGGGREVFLADNIGGLFTDAANLSNNNVDDSGPRIALDKDGEPHFAWSRNFISVSQIIYWNEALLQPQVVGVGRNPALFVDRAGVVHVVYERDKDLFHNTNDSLGRQFSNERPVLSTPLVPEASVSVGGDASGNIFITYESTNSLYFVTARPGTGFLTPQLLDTGGVSHPRMRVRNGGKVAIVYAKQGDLFYIVGQSSTLNLPPRRITRTPEVESRPSLDIDLTGSLHVSFIRDGHAFYINNACAPTPEFTAVPSSGEAPLTVRFSDLSSGAIEAWHWDFGDGTTSDLPEPEHVYRDPGNYDVSLTVTAAGGRDTTIEKSDAVFVQTPFNSLAVSDQKVLPGQRNVWFPVIANHVEPIQGFQLMGTYDPNFLNLHDTSLVFTVTEAMDPEFLEVNIFETFFEVGSIFDFVAPFSGRQLQPSKNRRLMNMICDVVVSAPAGAQTQVRLVNNREISRIFNIFTVNGFSVLPKLRSGTVSIEPIRFPLPRLFIRGDVDNNRLVDITDAITLLNFQFQGGARPRCLDAGDFLDTGVIDITSAISLLNFLFLGGTPPAVPFPNLGLDPTPDEIEDC